MAEETITMMNALDEMRELTIAGKTFRVKFRKWNADTRKGGDVVTLTRARMRKMTADEKIRHSSYKVFLTDVETMRARVFWAPLLMEFNGKKIKLM